MKLMFAYFCLLLIMGCSCQPNGQVPQDDLVKVRTSDVLKRQEAISKEILSIEYAFGKAMGQTNTVAFEAEAGPLADRLDNISKELDSLGSFPADLREATLKKLEDAEKRLNKLFESMKASDTLKQGSLQSDAAKKTEPVTDRYFAAWASVMTKAGLNLEPKAGK